MAYGPWGHEEEFVLSQSTRVRFINLPITTAVDSPRQTLLTASGE